MDQTWYHKWKWKYFGLNDNGNLSKFVEID